MNLKKVELNEYCFALGVVHESQGKAQGITDPKVKKYCSTSLNTTAYFRGITEYKYLQSLLVRTTNSYSSFLQTLKEASKVASDPFPGSSSENISPEMKAFFSYSNLLVGFRSGQLNTLVKGASDLIVRFEKGE